MQRLHLFSYCETTCRKNTNNFGISQEMAEKKLIKLHNKTHLGDIIHLCDIHTQTAYAREHSILLPRFLP